MIRSIQRELLGIEGHEWVSKDEGRGRDMKFMPSRGIGKTGEDLMDLRKCSPVLETCPEDCEWILEGKCRMFKKIGRIEACRFYILQKKEEGSYAEAR